MSMTGQTNKSPPCSPHTPTQELNDAEPEMTHGTTEEQGAYPRFLVVDGKDNERPLDDIHSVIVDRTIRGCTSASVHVEKMGKAYLVRVHCKTYADNLLSLGMVQDCPVKVTPHRSLNFSKGVVRFGRSANGLSTEDIIEEINTSPRNEELSEVTSANRVSIQKNGSKILTGTFFLTFKSEYLPTHLFLGFERFPVKRYVPNPRRCFKCQKFGHSSRTCRSKEDVCSICAATDHSYKDCNKQDSPHCSNYSGPHKASDQECPKYLIAKATLKLQAEKRLSPKEARKKAEAQHKNTSDQGRTWANVAAVEQADLLEFNFQLGYEKRQLQSTISELRVMNAALIAQIQGLEKRIHFLETSVGQSHTPSDVEDPQGPHTSEKPMVGSTHLDTSVDGVQNTTSVGSAHSTSVGDAHNLKSVGDAHGCPVTDPVAKANMASQTENGGASGVYTSVSPSQMLGTKTNKCPFICAKPTSEPQKEGGAKQEGRKQCSSDIPNHKTSRTPEK